MSVEEGREPAAPCASGCHVNPAPRVCFAEQARRHLLRIALTALVAAPCLSFGAVLVDVLTDAPNGATGYQIAAASERKQVSLMRGKQRLDPSPGIALAADDEIETGMSTSVLIRYPEGHEVLVMPRSRLRLKALFLVFGELFVRARGFFQAETAFLTAGVEGTEFILRAGRVDDDVEVVVGNGVVVCASKSKLWNPVRVGAGERLSARSLGDGVAGEPAETRLRGVRPEPQPGQGILYRGSNNSVVEKLSAPREALAHIQLIARSLDTLARR